jgi:hypothetical protein
MGLGVRCIELIDWIYNIHLVMLVYSTQLCELLPLYLLSLVQLSPPPIFGLMIYTEPYVIFLMQANPLRGQVEGGWVGLWKSRLFWAL